MAVRQGCSLSRVFDASSFGPNLSNWGDRALVEIMTCTAEGLTLTVRAAFGQDAMTPAPVWTDITDDVLEGNTRRGAQFEIDRMEPGGADITLANTHGDYWPGNAGELALSQRPTFDAVQYPRHLPGNNLRSLHRIRHGLAQRVPGRGRRGSHREGHPRGRPSVSARVRSQCRSGISTGEIRNAGRKRAR